MHSEGILADRAGQARLGSAWRNMYSRMKGRRREAPEAGYLTIVSQR